MAECPHKRLAHWTSLSHGDNTHTGRCHACGVDFGPFATWEEVRIAAGRKPSAAKKPISERAILEAAADRVCVNCKKSLSVCDESCVGQKECFINLSILEPITKEKS